MLKGFFIFLIRDFGFKIKTQRIIPSFTYSFAYSPGGPSLPVAGILIYLVTTVSQFVTLNWVGCDILKNRQQLGSLETLKFLVELDGIGTDDLFTASEALFFDRC